ncbi:MAG: ribonuclease G, partial [Polyangiaceae bacterium]
MARNLLVINVALRETRVALIEDGVIAELQIERARARNTVGNIVLGKVTRVLPGMQAAFIDVGMDRAAFLHVEDLIRPDDFEEYLAGAAHALERKSDLESKGDDGESKPAAEEDDDDEEVLVSGEDDGDEDEDDEDDRADDDPAVDESHEDEDEDDRADDPVQAHDEDDESEDDDEDDDESEDDESEDDESEDDESEDEESEDDESEV